MIQLDSYMNNPIQRWHWSIKMSTIWGASNQLNQLIANLTKDVKMKGRSEQAEKITFWPILAKTTAYILLVSFLIDGL